MISHKCHPLPPHTRRAMDTWIPYTTRSELVRDQTAQVWCISQGRTVFTAVCFSHCLYIEILLSLCFFLSPGSLFPEQALQVPTSRFLCQQPSTQSPRNFLSAGRISIILQTAAISDLKEHGWEPTGWFSAVTSEKPMGFWKEDLCPSYHPDVFLS